MPRRFKQHWFGDPVVQTLRGSPAEVLGAAEQALRANPAPVDIQVDRQAMKIRFRGNSLSAMEQYSGIGGELSVLPGSAGKSVVTISISTARISLQYPALTNSQVSDSREKRFAYTTIRKMEEILKHSTCREAQ